MYPRGFRIEVLGWFFEILAMILLLDGSAPPVMAKTSALKELFSILVTGCSYLSFQTDSWYLYASLSCLRHDFATRLKIPRSKKVLLNIGLQRPFTFMSNLASPPVVIDLISKKSHCTVPSRDRMVFHLTKRRQESDYEYDNEFDSEGRSFLMFFKTSCRLRLLNAIFCVCQNLH